MHVLDVGNHDDGPQLQNLKPSLRDAEITPLLPEGFERTLIETMEQMEAICNGPSEVVAGVQTMKIEKDELWTTGYRVHVQRTAGQIVLGGYEVSFWIQDGATFTKVAGPHLRTLYEVWEKRPYDLGAMVWSKIQEGLKLHLDMISARVTAKALETQDLLAEHRRLSGFLPKN